MTKELTVQLRLAGEAQHLMRHYDCHDTRRCTTLFGARLIHTIFSYPLSLSSPTSVTNPSKVAFRVMPPEGRRILRYCLQREPASPRPTLKLRPLSAVHYCIFSIFAAALHIWKSFLRPQPEEEPSRGDRDPLITQIYIFIIELNRIRLTIT